MPDRESPACFEFAVLTTQRSGSVLLVQALSSHPDVFCYHEFFRPGHRNELSLRAWLSSSPLRRMGRFLAPYHTSSAYLDELYRSRSDEQAIGFKLMYNQLRRHPELWLVFKRRPIRVIHLVRQNVLRTEVSAIRARETGVFHSKDTRSPAPPIEVPIGDLPRSLERRQRLIDRHRRRLHRLNHLEIRYEDLVDRREMISMRICDFLGVEPQLLVTDWKKVTLPNLADVVSNYAEVVSRLERTPFAALLDD